MMFTNKQLRQLIIPLIIEQLLSVTVGMADSVMIASVGEAAVSGVSLVDTVMVLMINIFAALATGGAVVAGQFIGHRREEDACRAADQLVIFTLILSVGVMAVMYAGQNLILNGVFGSIEADVMGHAKTYLLIVTASIPFIALYNCGAALFRSMGNSKISMQTSMMMNAINITGNAVLIFGLKLGVAGAAIPTLVSRIAAAALIMALLRRQNQQVHISKPFSWKPDRRMIQKILHIGVPNGLENSMFQLGKILVLSLVATFGTASIAANAVSNTIAMFQILPGMAVGFAILTVVSQCVGANDYDQAKMYTKKLIKLVYICMVGMNILVVAALPFIIKIYNLSELTGRITTQIIIYHALCCVTIWPMSFSMPNTLRASNDVRFTMVISIISMWTFRIAFSYLLGQFLGMGVFGVWVAMTIDWLFRAICFTVRYIKGKWKLQRI
ncbi:MATE family efflux transporter [Murimonas intestini]|uniref:Probable multidrug resistance protein NorM n=1 Tax=Murimonas intestini TaxID=1337051 RepID=A0AB73SZ13_9FIRM|nr:MATE family efflux transporter [Murimonas intestini]MCR1842920.1 MATE family efflux transporter [Murimonas intestini]MCR1868117.1 MATE family efflux transporter [Murimonas intestini]MCR1885391.1 MATE family efflux transporter [Murimonas intestini]